MSDIQTNNKNNNDEVSFVLYKKKKNSNVIYLHVQGLSLNYIFKNSAVNSKKRELKECDAFDYKGGVKIIPSNRSRKERAIVFNSVKKTQENEWINEKIKVINEGNLVLKAIEKSLQGSKTGQTPYQLILSVTDLLSMVLNNKDNENHYYRGVDNFSFNIEPTLYFKFKEKNSKSTEEEIVSILKEKEKVLVEKFLFRFKSNLDNKNYFEKLAIMRHHGLPCRIIDVTSNPLVSLYFACKNEKGSGMIYDLIIKESKTTIDKDLSDSIDSLKDNLVLPLHLKVATNDARLIAQNGSFIVCDNDYKYNSDSIILNKTFLVLNKKKILNELDALKINESTMFPDMDHYSEYLERTIL